MGEGDVLEGTETSVTGTRKTDLEIIWVAMVPHNEILTQVCILDTDLSK